MFRCLIEWWVYAWWPRSAVADTNSGESFSMCVSGWPRRTCRQKSTCSSARWKRLYSCLLWKNIQAFLLDWVPSLRLRLVLQGVACFFFLKLTENLCLYLKSFTPAFYPGFCAFPFNSMDFESIQSYECQQNTQTQSAALWWCSGQCFGFEAQRARRFSVWGLHVGPVSMWVLSRYVSASHLHSLWLWVRGVVYLCLLAVAMICWLV